MKITKADSELSIILGEGNPIGELSFIDKQLPSATAVAGEDSTLIRIPAGAFDELVESDVKIASKVYKSFALNLCRKLRDTNEWLSTKEWLSDIEKEISGRFHL